MSFSRRRAQLSRFSINPFGDHREFLSDPEIPKAFGIRDCDSISPSLFHIVLITLSDAPENISAVLQHALKIVLTQTRAHGYFLCLLKWEQVFRRVSISI
jgi:hypothetical protein